MNLPTPPPPTSGRRRPQETRTSGPTGASTAWMATRTLEEHGSHLLPWLVPGQEVLDLGCGPGTITLGMAERVLPGRATGLDTSPSAIAQAQRLATGLERVNTTFRTGNPGELPFADRSFDLVHAHALLEELIRPGEAIEEMDRVLRPGGIAALCSSDWNQSLIAPGSPALGFAMEAYQSFEESRGRHPGAGAWLASWADDAGWEILDSGVRYEAQGDARGICHHLAGVLEQEGAHRHAETWRRWGAEPGHTFARAWCHLIARKKS